MILISVIISVLPCRGRLWLQLRMLPRMFSKNQGELAERRKAYKLGTS